MLCNHWMIRQQEVVLQLDGWDEIGLLQIQWGK